MGVFLQTAIFPGSDLSAVQGAVAQVAQICGIGLDLEACQYAQNAEGTQALLAGEMGFDGLAEELSRICHAPVMLLYIYDGDFWGYEYYVAGKAVDRFSSCPDYISDHEANRESLRGNPVALVEHFPIQGPEAVSRYFSRCLNDEPEQELFAYPEDRYPYHDSWQMTDFMTKLGFPWAFGADGVGDSPAPQPQPTLGDILEENIPLQTYSSNEVFPLSGSLPTALSQNYIRDILGQKGFEKYAQKTPREIIEARIEAKLAFGCRSNRNYVEPRLCILSAFCALWQGNPEAAFWELYEAVGNGTENIELLRARGMVVPMFSKRHIAVSDLSQLIELDPVNQDIYLLCRAYFDAMWGLKVDMSRADLVVHPVRNKSLLERLVVVARRQKQDTPTF